MKTVVLLAMSTLLVWGFYILTRIVVDVVNHGGVIG